MGVRGKGKGKPFSKGFPSPSPGRRRQKKEAGATGLFDLFLSRADYGVTFMR